MNYTQLRQNLVRTIRQKQQKRSVQDESVLASLNSDFFYIDLDACVGIVIEKFRRYHCHVFSFEFHAWAMQKLKAKFGRDETAHVIPTTAADRDGKTKLFLHQELDSDLGKHGFCSESSSLVKSKISINQSNYVEVSQTDLPGFIEKLSHPGDLLKMAVEGYDALLPWHLICRRMIFRIKKMVVEAHEEKVPDLLWKLWALRFYFKIVDYKNINFDWT